MAWEVAFGIILLITSVIMYFRLKMSKVIW